MHDRKGFTLWLTGLSGAGKTTLAAELARAAGSSTPRRSPRWGSSAHKPLERTGLFERRSRYQRTTYRLRLSFTFAERRGGYISCDLPLSRNARRSETTGRAGRRQVRRSFREVSYRCAGVEGRERALQKGFGGGDKRLHRR